MPQLSILSPIFKRNQPDLIHRSGFSFSFFNSVKITRPNGENHHVHVIYI